MDCMVASALPFTCGDAMMTGCDLWDCGGIVDLLGVVVVGRRTVGGEGVLWLVMH